MKRHAGITILPLFFIQLCFAQYTIKGTVKDELQQPMQAVNIAVGKKILPTITDSAGNFAFYFSSKNITLSFSHVGYETFIVTISNENVPPVTMVRSSQFLAETVVTAFEKNRNIKNIPAAITVLNKASLERYSNESFIPAVNTVPGVKMDERSPGSYRLSIRGNLLRSTFGVRNVKVYWNGIPFTDANGNTYFNELSLNHIGKIEILKGPSGSMYGSGTGGVVLLRSDLNVTKGRTATLQVNAGSYGSAVAAVSLHASDQRSVTALSVTHQQSDGYRAHTNLRRDVVNFAGTWFMNVKQSISANIFYSDLYYKTPGALTQAEMQRNPRQARPAAGIFQSAEAQKAALYLKTWYAGIANEYCFNSNWINTTALYVSNTNFKNPTIRNYEVKTEEGIGARTVLKYQRRIFSAVAGAEYQNGFSNTGTFGNNLGERDTLQYRDRITAQQFNLFLQADVNLMEDLILNAGISFNKFYYGFVRVNNFPATKESSNFTPQLVPRISLLKKIKNRVTVYAAVSKGYSPPSIDEVHAGDGNFNKELDAETAVNYEAGIKADIIKEKLFVDISYYLLTLKHTIVSRRDASGGDYFVNAGKTKQRGLEATVNYLPVNNSSMFIRRVGILLNYTNIHARFVNYEQGTAKFDGNKLTGTAPNIIVAVFDMNTAPGIYTNLTYSYTDMIPVNDANSFYANAYNLFFGRLGYKTSLGKNISTDIFFGYNKSFNAPYSLGNDLNAAANRYFNPAAPQSFSGGIKLKLIIN